MLQSPKDGDVIKTSATGFAFSAYGIREVNLLFNNGGIRIPTRLQPDAALSRTFHWYDATSAPRFIADLSKRPFGIWRDTDVQVEIIDGRGERVLLDDIWVIWP